jgi:hypothetical protein
VTLLDRRGALHLDVLAGNVNLASPAVQSALQHQAPPSQLAGIVAQQASTLAFADAFYVLGAVTLLLTPLVLLLRTRRAPLAAT